MSAIFLRAIFLRSIFISGQFSLRAIFHQPIFWAFKLLCFPCWVVFLSVSPPICVIWVTHYVCHNMCVAQIVHLNFVIFVKYDILGKCNSKMYQLCQVLYSLWLCHSQKSESFEVTQMFFKNRMTVFHCIPL